VDVRDTASFQSGHITGALNIPINELQQRYKELNPGDWIITYCT
jgi:rhodanese-related sulfurtransferase